MKKPTSNTDQKILIKKLAAGNIQAFQEIFYIYEKQLKYYAFRLTKSKFIAEEIVQEVFIKIWENRRNINPDLSFQAYLYRMVRNRAFNYLRDSVQHEDLAQGLWQDILRARDQTDDNIIAADYENLIHKILQELPSQKRLIYMMSRFEGKSNPEIAAQLGISVKTVENHLWKTLRIIKAQLSLHLNITWLLVPAMLFFLP